MFILYHTTTLTRIGTNTYNSLADAELAKQSISTYFSHYTIGICEIPELERMKRQRQIEAWRKSKIHLNKPRVKVVGD